MRGGGGGQGTAEGAPIVGKGEPTLYIIKKQQPKVVKLLFFF